MKNALITLAIGLSETECQSQDTFRAYADKFGLSFEVLDKPKFRIHLNLFN